MPPKTPKPAKKVKAETRARRSYAERFQKKLDLVSNVLAIDVKEAAAQLPPAHPLAKFAADGAALAAAWSALRGLPELAKLTGRMRAHSAVPGQAFRLSGNALRRAKVLHGDAIAEGPWSLDRVADSDGQYYIVSSLIDKAVREAVPVRNASRDKGTPSAKA